MENPENMWIQRDAVNIANEKVFPLLGEHSASLELSYPVNLNSIHTLHQEIETTTSKNAF